MTQRLEHPCPPAHELRRWIAAYGSVEEAADALGLPVDALRRELRDAARPDALAPPRMIR
jgi:hypothetical protein